MRIMVKNGVLIQKPLKAPARACAQQQQEENENLEDYDFDILSTSRSNIILNNLLHNQQEMMTTQMRTNSSIFRLNDNLIATRLISLIRSINDDEETD